MTTKGSAIELLAEATMKAAVFIATERGINNQENFAERLSDALKETVKSNLDQVQKEWADALEANVSNAWLQELMKVQAVELAQKAIKVL
jgi:predicted metal-dependent hydrolase